MFIHMPLLRMLCVPYYSPTAKGCHMIELINLLAIPEENRVVFLFTRKYQNDNPPPLRYEPRPHTHTRARARTGTHTRTHTHAHTRTRM